MNAKHNAGLAELSRSALVGTDLTAVMRQAVALVVETLEIESSAILELLPKGSTLVLREGVGWQDGAVGQATLPLDGPSLAGDVCANASWVLVADWENETRFSQPALLRDHQVICGLYVGIHGQHHPYGMLAANSTVRRTFTTDELHFLQAVANILALVIGRMQTEESLRASDARFRRLVENAADIIYRYHFAPTPGFDYVSPAATAITGYTPDDYYADPQLILRLAHPDDRPLLDTHLRSPSAIGNPLTLRLTRRDGTLIWTEQRVVPILDAAGNLLAVEGIVRDIARRKHLEAELAEAHRRFAESRETARLFLARELHDSAVQQLLGISYQLAAHGRRGSDRRRPMSQRLAELTAALTDGRHAILGVVRQLRSLIGELRPAGLEEFGLTTALQGYVTRLEREAGVQQAEISLDLIETGTCLPHLTAICLFRIAQEALRNALKHAAARHIRLSLSHSANAIVLRVVDDGRGFQVPDRLSELAQDDHFGLIGMVEWGAWVDGQLTVQSHADRGTEVTIRIPLSPSVSFGRCHESEATGT